jgi:hypothetical protein
MKPLTHNIVIEQVGVAVTLYNDNKEVPASNPSWNTGYIIIIIIIIIIVACCLKLEYLKQRRRPLLVNVSITHISAAMDAE